MALTISQSSTLVNGQYRRSLNYNGEIVGYIYNTGAQTPYELVLSDSTLSEGSRKNIISELQADTTYGNRLNTKGYTFNNSFYDWGGNIGSIDPDTGEFVAATTDFKNQQEKLYNQIQTGYDDLAKQANTVLNQVGNQGIQDINTAYKSNVGTGTNDLISRGLSNSTVLPTMKLGYQQQRQAEINRLNDTLAQQKIGYQTDILGQKYQNLAIWSNPELLYNTMLKYGSS